MISTSSSLAEGKRPPSMMVCINFLNFSDLDLFAKILDKLIIEWKHSCEHYLTNRSMNRIAWLGQAAVCYHSGVPSKYSYAWSMLTEDQQNEANDVALKALNKWMELNDRNKLDIEEALSIGRQTELY